MADDKTVLSPDQGTRNQASAQQNGTGSGGDNASASTLDKVKETATGLLDHATEAARTAANEGKDKANEALETVTKVVTNLASTVEEKVGPTYGKYARDAATGVSNFADTLKSKDIDALVADTRNYVRENPLIAIGIASALGFVVTRLVKLGGESAIASSDA